MIQRVDDLDALHNSDDGSTWRRRGRRSSKGSEVPDLPSNNFSGFYSKDELLSFYSPYIRPPTGFPYFDKLTSKTPLQPVALQTAPSLPIEDEVGL